MSVRVLIRDFPHRTIALCTGDRALIFRHTSSTERGSRKLPTGNQQNVTPRCMVEFVARRSIDEFDYRVVSKTFGTLGLITLGEDVFLCTITLASEAATIRPGESVQRIQGVEFYCLNRADYDYGAQNQPDPYPGESFASDETDYGSGSDQADTTAEHPFNALRKLFSNGYFYYSCDFDLTSRLQERADNDGSFDVGTLHQGLLWNSYMISPLLEFRRRLEDKEQKDLDDSRILTSVIRGFVRSLTIPASASPLRRAGPSNLPSQLTVVSRLSSRRAGTRFNSRGIDDYGNVANFVETETIFWHPAGICFSYVQIRGSVPIFWESSSSLLPGQQKIQITRSPEATQPAFDKHFERLAQLYGAAHIVNLLSASKPGEVELSEKYRYHTHRSPLRQGGGAKESSEHFLLSLTEFDFHAETRGAGGYDGARAIRPYLERSADGFAYFLSQETEETVRKGSKDVIIRMPVVLLQQEGVFRVNCLDCLDRTNVVQTLISQLALQSFLTHRSEKAAPDFWTRHSSLWADNGDTLSKIYAGTGALKSSFTRHGKMSLGGAFADIRKSATRLYVNNFADKGRQNTIDLLLGRLMGQAPVELYDPVNDHVTNELLKRKAEYQKTESIGMWCGTFNLNGRSRGASEDLSAWLCATLSPSRPDPEIFAVGYQEMVELSPQQIMSTDPARRATWEEAVKRTLNSSPRRSSSEDYVVLRSGQLVGAALIVLVKASVLGKIKNVEGAIKKTGLSGMAGNKGAVAIRLDYASTSLCFVTAHLAAGFENVEERNRDYTTINHGLHFQKNRGIENHDSIIWLGDFNYRVGLSNDGARRLVRTNDLDTLYDNDQLNIQMVAGLVFQHYSESRITFPPTYRFDVGTDTYDTSEKNRIPAWCDRILRRGNNLRQIDYNSAPLHFSDHKPVFATFECSVSIVDEKIKAALSKTLYDTRRADVGSSHAAADGHNARGSNTDDEADSAGDEAVAPGLPPASSDQKKWWLEGDRPARSEVRPPRAGMIPNVNRSVNPYRVSSIDEADWVDVERPQRSSTGTSRPYSREGSAKPEPPPVRRAGKGASVGVGDAPSEKRMSMISMTPRPVREPVSTGPPRPVPPPSRSLSTTSTSSTLTKKEPPSKPKKPTSLTSPPSQSATFPRLPISQSLSQSAAKSALTQGFTRTNSVNIPKTRTLLSHRLPDSSDQNSPSEIDTPRLQSRTSASATFSVDRKIPSPPPKNMPKSAPKDISSHPPISRISSAGALLTKPRPSPPERPPRSSTTKTSPLNSIQMTARPKSNSPRRSRSRERRAGLAGGRFDPHPASLSRDGSADARGEGTGGPEDTAGGEKGSEGGVKPKLPPRGAARARQVGGRKDAEERGEGGPDGGQTDLMDQAVSWEEQGTLGKWKILKPD